MSAWIMVLALTLSSSIDNLGVGISYGIRNIRISHFSNMIISVICFLFSLVGIYFGLWLSKILPGIMPVVIGSFLLVIIGIRIILLAVPRKQQVSVEGAEYEVATTETDVKGEIKDLTNVLGKSEGIGFVESVLLGIGLSVNALTNGLGAGLFGLSPIAICVAASIGSFLTVWGGVALGRKIAHIRIGRFTVGQFGTLISGTLLLIIACAAFFD
ncbi:sporulation membrane protein YtaF [Bacillus paramycoides]|uniref:sporulation membrane protein YtaF n=1 Tax=Bacillus paramycoides TaxID=2026194 RepID=UPI003B968CE4